MKKKAKTHLQLTPHDISPECWWYEMDKGIEIIVEHRSKDGSQYFHTAHYVIPWPTVRAALSRKNADLLQLSHKAKMVRKK